MLRAFSYPTPPGIDSELLDNGTEMAPARGVLNNAAGGPSGSGQLVLTGFTAKRTAVVNTISMVTGNTAAGATPTLCRIGVWSVNDAGDIALIAATANDPTLFAATYSRYDVPLTTPWAKVIGSHYAVGVLIVTAATVPSFMCDAGVNAGAVNPLFALAPLMGGRVSPLADLPASVASGVLPGYALRPGFLLS